jgi:hypothetical protein
MINELISEINPLHNYDETHYHGNSATVIPGHIGVTGLIGEKNNKLILTH